MKFIGISFVLMLCTCVANSQERISSRNNTIVFKSVNVVPMEKEEVLTNQTVVVRDGQITAIGPEGKVTIDAGATVIDAKGKYLIPGLSEMHAHVPPIDDIEPMKEVLFLYLANGITTIRGMLGHTRHLELRTKLQAGEILGPHLYTTGPSFSGLSVKTADYAEKLVREQKAAGYDYLKLHPGLTNETFSAIAKTAKEVGIPFAGHVSFRVGIWKAIDAGYSSIDHLDGFIEGMVPGIDSLDEQKTGLFGIFVADRADTTQTRKLMTALRTHNVWVVPTQALAERWLAPLPSEVFERGQEMKYMKQEDLTAWVASKKSMMANAAYEPAKAAAYVKLRRRLIFECQRQGVGLLLGSDAPQVFNVPGFSIHHELNYLVNSGLTPYEALRTGTVNVAKYLGKSANTGAVKAGYVSDLVLLSGNPLDDIWQTRNIEGVMLGTEWLPKSWIQGELKKYAKR